MDIVMRSVVSDISAFCEINFSAEQHVGKENCVKSFKKVNAV